jgi:hypothetical protein
MRIISKFNDYYDNIAHSIDVEGKYWNRDQIIIDNDDKETPLRYSVYEPSKVKNNHAFWKRNLPALKPFILGFCGTLYPLVIEETYSNGYRFSINTVDIGKCRPKGNTKELNKNFKNNTVDYDCTKYISYRWTDRSDFCDLKHNPTYLNLFEQHKVPTFLVSVDKIILNPVLEQVMFYRVKDNYQTYQELDQYLSSGIFDEPINSDPLKDNEKLKLQAHGMDKWSFKKQKSKK